MPKYFFQFGYLGRFHRVHILLLYVRFPHRQRLYELNYHLRVVKYHDYGKDRNQPNDLIFLPHFGYLVRVALHSDWQTSSQVVDLSLVKVNVVMDYLVT